MDVWQQADFLAREAAVLTPTLVQAAAAVVPVATAVGAAPDEAGKAGQAGLQDMEAAEHCNKSSIYVFLFWKLRGLSPNFHIHVSVIFPGSVHIFGWSKIDRPILEIYKYLTDI
jgi:hypothetical protein